MKKTLVTFGILLILMPFLGFLQSWKDIFSIIAGLVLLFIAFFNRRVALSAKEETKEDVDGNTREASSETGGDLTVTKEETL